MPHVSGENQGSNAPRNPDAPSRLAWSLEGELPCIGCRYNLRGLSIRGRCPECGIAIRATILAVVDPRAKEFEPLRHPSLTSAGMVTWACAGVGAVALTWWIRLNDYIGPTGAPATHDRFVAALATALLLLSGIAALTLVRPHARIERWQVAMAIVGVAAYLPLAYLYWQLHGVMDTRLSPPYLEESGVRPWRIAMRLGIITSAVTVLIGLRPVARAMAARSLVIRMGRVDRQTILAMVAALAVAAAGDLLQLASLPLRGDAADIVRQAGVFLVATGSALCTIGIIGVLIDVLRIAPVLVRPPPTLGALLGRQPAAPPNHVSPDKAK